MIEDIVKIHDRYQFEIKLNYQLENDAEENAYEVETYFFIPNSLGVNRRTYSKEDFYQDMKSYIRFKTPSLLLRQICSGEAAPLENLRKSFVELTENTASSAISSFEYHNKMFSAILKSALRDHISLIFKKEHAGDLSDLVHRYIESTPKIVAEFRKLRKIINVPSVSEQVFAIYLFSDEYISLLVEKYTYDLLELLKKKSQKDYEKFSGKLLGIIHREIQHRQHNGYHSMPENDSDNESLIFRYSVLKKYLESVLYLNTDVEPEGKFWEHFLLSLAAGIAMIFATGIAFFSQRQYGNFTIPLFVALVISYMFKDRIKEIFREYFMKKISRSLFDHKTKIYMDSKFNIGKYREGFYFIPTDKVPEPVSKIRNRDRTLEFDNKFANESVILFRKQIRINPGIFENIYSDYPVEGINDILRFNVERFLNKMDNPRKALYVLTDESFKKIYGERVYHVNMVIKYTMGQTVMHKRFRLVLNRNGIKRIEKVAVVTA